MNALSLTFLAAALATASTGTDAAGESAEAASATPVAPTFFFASIQDGRLQVTIPSIGDEPDPTAEIEFDTVVDEGDARVPGRIRELEPDAFVFTTGKLEAPKRIGFGAEGGASDTWWTAVYEADKLKTGTGLAIVGAADGGSLRAPAPIKVKSDEGEKWIEAVRGVLDEKLSKLDRTYLGRKVLSQSRVSVFPGTFPNDGVALVTVNVPLRSKDPDALPRTISGMFTLTKEGSLANVIIAPKTGHDSVELKALGDVDADGHEDAIYTSTYYEGAYEHLLRWDDGSEPQLQVIAGDGA